MSQVRKLDIDLLQLPVRQCIQPSLCVNAGHVLAILYCCSCIPSISSLIGVLIHMFVRSAAGIGCDTRAPCRYRNGCGCSGRLSGNEEDRSSGEFTFSPRAIVVPSSSSLDHSRTTLKADAGAVMLHWLYWCPL